jgi:hypothetical protein
MSEAATALKATPASDKVVLGVIGTGGHGSFVSTMFPSRADVEIAYVCDVHRERLKRVRMRWRKSPARSQKASPTFAGSLTTDKWMPFTPPLLTTGTASILSPLARRKNCCDFVCPLAPPDCTCVPLPPSSAAKLRVGSGRSSTPSNSIIWI